MKFKFNGVKKRKIKPKTWFRSSLIEWTQITKRNKDYAFNGWAGKRDMITVANRGEMLAILTKNGETWILKNPRQFERVGPPIV